MKRKNIWSLKLNKIDATNIIIKELSPKNFNIKNGGNVKFANVNKGPKKVWWLNIHIDDRLLNDYHIILNNHNKNEFLFITIPPNTLNEGLFKKRFDKTNNKDKLDLEISYDSSRYLIDTKSGGTEFDFNKYLVRTFNY